MAGAGGCVPFPPAALRLRADLRAVRGALGTDGTETTDLSLRDLQDERDQVAVIGLACRFPGADDPAELWRNVRDGVESITFFGADELRALGVPAATVARPDYVPARGVLREVERFDAEFFGLTPREAELMDPQQRVFLECCQEACETAGYDPQSYAGRIGVYGGSGFNSYLLIHLLTAPERLRAAGLQARLFNDKDFLTTQVSYRLNLRGPSVAVQTACSTALVAVHLACQALLQGECSMALAGGVTISFPHRGGYLHQEGGIASPDGHCRAFDAAAAGTVESNGAGVVLLKRLDRALADGDPVRAVVRGSAINNDGAAKASYTAPSVESQTEVIAEALAIAQVDAATIGYVEAHGSGTPLGDPIEVEALTRAFRAATAGRGFCALGSVKANLGHADTAAGAASLLKTVAALEHRQLPPSIHCERPNPRLHLDESPFYVNDRLRDWPAAGGPRRAGVNSLGIGGTNAHVVLEEAPPRPAPAPSRPWQLLLLSARSGPALAAAAERLAAALAGDFAGTPPPDLADAAHTLRIGRAAYRHRRAVVCRDRADAVARLRGEGERAPEHDLGAGGAGGEERRVAFLLPGLGEHYAGMAGGLYRTEPAFRDAIDRCAGHLAAPLGRDLRELLWPDGPAEAAAAPGPQRLDLRRAFAETAREEGPLARTAHAHPAVFAVEYALAELLAEWGIRPWAMIGYSLGEYVAACLAGVLPLAGALTLVAERAKLVDALPAGSMLAVPLPAEEVLHFLATEPELALAAANGPAMSVVGGPREAVDRMARLLAGRGVASRRLQTAHAFHTPMMQPAVPRLLEIARGVPLAPPRLPVVSNVTGTFLTAEQATDPAYWAEHLCRPVRFAEGLAALLAGEPRLLLEVGPGQTLGTLARQHPERKAGQAVVPTLREAREAVSDQAFLLESLGRLWLHGARPDWQGFTRRESRRRVPLPTYAFDRRRYFVDPPAAGDALPAPPSLPATVAERAGAAGRAPLAGWGYAPAWEASPALAPGGAGGVGGAGGPAPRRRWLLLLPAGGEEAGARFGDVLAGRLAAAGEDVVRAVVGSRGSGGSRGDGGGFAEHADGSFALAPGSADDLRALLAALHSAGGLPDRVVHLLALTGPADAALVPAPREVEQAEESGFWTLLALAQAWGALAGAPPLHLAVVADGLFQVGGGDAVRPQKATLLGPVRVLPQEVPDWTASAIDVVLPVSAAGQEELAARLLGELREPAAAGRVEPAVAWRGRSRSVRRFRPVALAVPAVSRLRRGGAYLLAGGLDETGLALAEHFFRSAAARLTLLLPEEAPPRQRWGEWLSAYDDQDETAMGLRRLLALESAGCELLALPVDLEDPFAVAAAVGRARQRFGRIDGAVHAAGAGGAGLAQWKQRAAAAAVLGPKVRGLHALAGALAGEPLDLLLLCGSSLGATGGFGQVDTSAAAAFLSAFAEAAMARPEPPAALVQAIDWGLFRWQPVTGGDALSAQLAAGLDAYGIGAGEMAEVLERALASGLPRLLVSTRDFAAVSADLDAWSPSGLAASLDAGPAGAFHPRPELRAAYVAPRGPIEEAIAEVWQDAFGIERIGVHDDFFELAGNSLLAIQVVTRLSTRLGVQLPMAAVLETPTIAALAAHVAEIANVAKIAKVESVARVEGIARLESIALVEGEPAAAGTAAAADMDRLLREIEAMSLDEARQRLESDDRGDEGAGRPVGTAALETA